MNKVRVGVRVDMRGHGDVEVEVAGLGQWRLGAECKESRFPAGSRQCLLSHAGIATDLNFDWQRIQELASRAERRGRRGWREPGPSQLPPHLAPPQKHKHEGSGCGPPPPPRTHEGASGKQ